MSGSTTGLGSAYREAPTGEGAELSLESVVGEIEEVAKGEYQSIQTQAAMKAMKTVYPPVQTGARCTREDPVVSRGVRG